MKMKILTCIFLRSSVFLFTCLYHYHNIITCNPLSNYKLQIIYFEWFSRQNSVLRQKSLNFQYQIKNGNRNRVSVECTGYLYTVAESLSEYLAYYFFLLAVPQLEVCGRIKVQSKARASCVKNYCVCSKIYTENCFKKYEIGHLRRDNYVCNDVLSYILQYFIHVARWSQN